MLLPEFIHVEGQIRSDETPFVHTISGRWEREGEVLCGRLRAHGTFGVQVLIREHDGGIRTQVRVKNIGDAALPGVSLNICAGVSHLPGRPGWSNRDFIAGEVPLERSAQGRFWYEAVTPRGLKVLTSHRWEGIHPNPSQPSAEGVENYGASPTEDDGAIACAAASMDGESLLYQCWSSPGRWLPPFPGNACMHLLPKLVDLLQAGEEARVDGAVGIFDGGWEALALSIEDGGMLRPEFAR